MLKLQEKLFFRNKIRTILLVFWLMGSITYFVYLFLQSGIEDLTVWGASTPFFSQFKVCYYYFVVMAILAFDYFREIPDADVTEIVQVSGRGIQNDSLQFFVMLQYVVLSIVLFLGFGVFYFGVAGSLTWHLVCYLCKVSIVYMGLNGIAAVLCGWFLARRTSKIIGYVCIFLFCFLFGNVMVDNIKLLSFLDTDMVRFFRPLFIMPEGFLQEDGSICVNDQVLYPVHLSQICRILFWFFLIGIGIVSCYRFHMKKLSMVLLGGLSVACFCYMIQPISFYAHTNAYDQSDATWYDEILYVEKGSRQQEKNVPFVVERYQMNVKLGQNMKVDAWLYVSQTGLNIYEMTLYHQFKIVDVTDKNGEKLEYTRQGDYLTIYNEQGNLDAVHITYQGGGAYCYANAEELYLPAWFPYYPMAGFHYVYDVGQHMYLNNMPETEAQFDICFTSNSKIYSDLPQTGENHFVGTAKGAVFVSGFYTEEELDNGVKCIYSYLAPYLKPYARRNQNACEQVLQHMVDAGIWKNYKNKKVIFIPSLVAGISYTTPEAIVCDYSWEMLAKECGKEEMFSWEDEGENEAENREENVSGAGMEDEELIAVFVDWYESLKEINGDSLSYEDVKTMFTDVFGEYIEGECTDEMFEEFFIEHVGEDALKDLKGDG